MKYGIILYITPIIQINFLGPSDLSISLGVTPKHDLTHPDMVAATSKVLAGCKARSKVILASDRSSDHCWSPLIG